MRAWLIGLSLLVLTHCGGSSEDDGNDAGAGGTGGGSDAGATGGSGAVGGSSGNGGSGGSGATGGSSGTGGAAGSGGSAGSPGVNCNPNDVTCFAPTPSCAPGEVPSVQDHCWGPCVPILTCDPVADCSQCQNGFCAVYEAFTTEYRCVLPTLQCSAVACSCLAPYFCVGAFDACSPGSSGGPIVHCSCPTC